MFKDYSLNAARFPSKVVNLKLASVSKVLVLTTVSLEASLGIAGQRWSRPVSRSTGADRKWHISGL